MRTRGATLRLAMLAFASVSVLRCSAPTSPTRTLTVTRLRADQRSFEINTGYNQPATLVIRSADDLASAWAIIYRNISPVPSLPSVNLATEMIVGVAIGQQPNANVQVVITGATETNGAITVEATVTTPGPSCVVLPTLTEPVDLARIPATAGSVVVNLTHKTNSC